MKKTLVALASMAALGAFAQSSVTLYGRLDLGMDQNKTTTVDAAGTTTTVGKQTSLAGDQSALTTARLGVRGVEDLGGGLRLGFNWETAINADEVASVGNTRLANLSLSGDFGAFIIGTYDNAFDTVRGYNQAVYSVPGGDFLANMFNTSAAGGAALFPGIAAGVPVGLRQRSQNAIGYRSNNYGGFTFGLGFSNEKVTNAANGVVAAGAGGLAKLSGYQLSAGYANGPLAANFVVGSAKASVAGVPTSTVSSTKLGDWAIAASYDFGVAKPWFAYENAKTTGTLNGVGVPGAVKGNGFSLGVVVPVGAFAPFISVSSGKFKDDLGGPPVFSAKVSGVQVGARYSLSKRTTAYAAFGNDKIKDSTAAPFNSSFSSKRNGYAIGLRHDF